MSARRVRVIGLVSGLHLALLQFGYLLTGQMHLSSGYLTYAVVTLLWMLGCLLGLWLALPAAPIVALGVLAYAAAFAAFNLHPFAPWLPWVAAPCVLASGLWAGRYFALALARVSTTTASGRVFADENHGFTLGIVVTFVGYALRGRWFLLLAPIVTGAILLLALRRWRAPGAAVAVAVALTSITGCDAPEDTRLPAPDRALFERQAYPALLRDCGFSGCHGDPSRAFQVYGPGRARLPGDGEDEVVGHFDAPTERELSRSYERARAMLTTSDDPLAAPLLRKPLEDAGHRGRDAQGRNVYRDRQADGYLALEGWVRGVEVEEAEAP